MVTVHQALASVMRDLPGIGKTDRSPEGFDFRGIEAMTKVVGPILAEHGVVIVPTATLTQTVASPAMKEGWQDIYLEVDWTIYGPAGDSITARTNGIGRDKTDRGANKAATQAYKYLLLHLFCVADKADDADGHTYEQDRADQPPPFTKAVGKRVAVREFRMRGLDEPAAKREASEMWTAFGMDALDLTEQLVVEKVGTWLGNTEPFQEPSGEGPAEVDSPSTAQHHGGPVAAPSPDAGEAA